VPPSSPNISEAPPPSDRDRNGFANQQDHLKARRPGECRITSKADSVKIPFVPVYGDRSRPEAYGLDVTLNGKTRRLQVDTGASGILLTSSAAKSLHLEPEYHLHTGGVGDEGEVQSYLTHVASIHIGGVEISDCMVEVLGKSKLDVDGLIGIDTFSQWLATLDYQDAELRLNPLPPRPPDKLAEKPDPALNTTGAEGQQIDDDERLPHDAIVPPGMQDWLPVIRFGHELLLPSTLNKGPLHYLMADTGAATTLFSLAAAKEAGKPKLNSDANFTGVSGKVNKVYFVDNINLAFGQLRLPPRSFPAFDITHVSHDTGTEVSGFVGLETLSRLTITIDYRDNLMLLKYDPNHDIQRF